jgi:hypothetical protein
MLSGTAETVSRRKMIADVPTHLAMQWRYLHRDNLSNAIEGCDWSHEVVVVVGGNASPVARSFSISESVLDFTSATDDVSPRRMPHWTGSI